MLLTHSHFTVKDESSIHHFSCHELERYLATSPKKVSIMTFFLLPHMTTKGPPFFSSEAAFGEKKYFPQKVAFCIRGLYFVSNHYVSCKISSFMLQTLDFCTIIFLKNCHCVLSASKADLQYAI